VRLRRLIIATFACSGVVLGITVFIGSGPAGAAAKPKHSCSVTDKHFIETVKSNMTQLGYWSDALISGDATPALVIKQARAEAAQIGATGPTDLTLRASQSYLKRMFLEYAAAVRAKALGTSPGVHVRNAYVLANSVHDLLVDAEPALVAQGCNVASLLSA
jgi:hypothetical protein